MTVRIISTARLLSHLVIFLVTNLLGAIWAALVPTVIALAFYFCVADAVLIVQCLYYNYYYTHTLLPSPPAHLDPSENPRQPLLIHQGSNLGLPGSRRRSSAASHKQQYSAGGICPSDMDLEGNRRSRLRIVNAASVIGICLVGAAGWAIVWGAGLWTPVHDDTSGTAARGPVGAELLGYVSAVCYLGYSIFDSRFEALMTWLQSAHPSDIEELP